MSNKRLSRRAMLRGVGCTVALPWMESMSVWGDEVSATNDGNMAPVRMAVLFSGCGYHSQQWWAKGQGADMQLGKVLEPLKPHRSKLNFIKGL
ncbi:MAG: DUF1552 domain-containing protein, partial [Planctomycetaceae bacterium]|nr:DUF1552 domain-containing protein [Planctomycetaceae bacterium]